MFKILGSDGKEYGPVTDGQLRQWISEGRAGGLTRVKPQGANGWILLNTVPEFADLFRAPTVDSGAASSMPPVVRILAFAFLAIAAVSAMRLLMSLFAMWRFSGQTIHAYGLSYYLSWAVGLLSVPARITCGIGLLFGKPWAWRLTIGLSAVLTLFGAWGLVQIGASLSRIMADNPQFLIQSPAFLVGQVWSVAVFLFNIAAAVILTRKPVRDAFARKSSATV